MTAQGQAPQIPIRAAHSTLTPPRAPAERRNCLRQQVNEQRNSRVSYVPAQGTFHPRWAVALDPDYPSTYILQTGDRIVLGGEGHWDLLGTDGKSIKRGSSGPGEIVLDSASPRFYTANAYGRLQAFRRDDGTSEFKFSLFSTNLFYRSFIAPSGRQMIIASYQRNVASHSHAPADTAAIEMQDLGDPLKIDDGDLVSAKRGALLEFQTTNIHTAMTASLIAIALPNQIFIAEPGLVVRHVLEGPFEPLTMSLDETGRVYLMVVSNQRRQLWLVTPQGERVFTFDIPPNMSTASTPPIVGYDHRIYLLAGSNLVAISPEGRLVWQAGLDEQLIGGVVTPQDTVVVSAGSAVVEFDSDGRHHQLFGVPDGPILTAPVVTSDGDILVASRLHLYLLTAHK